MFAKLIDAQVAGKVFGYKWFAVGDIAVLVPPYRFWQFDDHPSLYTPLPNGPGKLEREHIDGQWFLSDATRMPEIPLFSQKIDAAWWLVEELRKHVDLKFSTVGKKWRVCWPTTKSDGEVVHTDFKRAICKAALTIVKEKTLCLNPSK